jgi:hypothetical protein
MRYLLVFTFLLSAANAIACDCKLIKIKSKEDLKKFDFVALVKVEEIAPKNDKLLPLNGNVKIHIDELFKGNSITTINVSDFAFTCLQQMPEKGEQLLIFGNMVNGKLTTSTCSFFRMADGKLPTYAYIEDIESLKRLTAEK